MCAFSQDAPGLEKVVDIVFAVYRLESLHEFHSLEELFLLVGKAARKRFDRINVPVKTEFFHLLEMAGFESLVFAFEAV